jgi:flagellar basal body-associated protein FliL
MAASPAPAPAHDAKKDAPATAASADAKGGGLMAWLPLILSLTLMPAVAYAMTAFVLVPKLQKSLGGGDTVAAREHGAEGEAAHGSEKSAGEKEKGHGKEAKAKIKVPLSKIVVNVSGSLGTRLLVASVTLVGSAPDFKTRVEDATDQLRDLSSSTLGSKTISDLEKPESRNLIRSELLAQFNAALGGQYVQEIYITELAIQ